MKSQAVALLLALTAALAGCSTARPNNPQTLQTLPGLTRPTYDHDVNAICDPPLGWKPDPLKVNSNHTHQAWLSPTRDTAYGVIHFQMPLPLGVGVALSGFLSNMKRTEGSADLLWKENDPNLPGIRFMAAGGIYCIRCNLIVDGWEGWACYAGTLRAKPINQEELDLAQRARDHTRVGRPAGLGS